MNLKFKKWVYACLTLLSFITIKNSTAQCVELVSNGNFETLTATPPSNSLPGYTSFITYASGWVQHNVPIQNGTPDLFTTASPSNPSSYNSVHVPCSWYGYQNAHTGNAYAGLLTTTTDNAYWGARCTEFIQTSFSSTLTAGKIYEVNLWVSKADLAGYNINGLGIWIGDLGINAQSDIPTYNCPTSLLNNDAWTQISFPYCANGSETIIIIGGSTTVYGSTLTTPSPTCTQNCNYSNPSQTAGSYIFIDDVSVKEVTFAVPTQTLCSNQTGTFTAVPTCSTINTAALTYTWNYGDGTTAVSTSTLCQSTHSFNTPGNYTSSVTVGTGTCTQTFTFNVVVPNVTSAISSGTVNTICNGTYCFTATPTPAGSYNYNWTLTDATTNSVIPSSTYTVTNGNSPNPCINFANINQNVYIHAYVTTTLGCTFNDSLFLPSCCATPTNVIKYANTTYSTSTVLNSASGTNSIALGGTITVNSGGTLTIISKNVLMEPNTKIILNGTGRINLLNSYVQGCNYMWDGIYANTTNTVTISNSRVEDAKRVVVDSLGTASLNIINNYLNKNYIGIMIKAAKSSSSSVLIRNNFFSCSSIPTTGSVPYKPIVTNLSNAASLGAYSSTVLKAPYSTLQSNCGIFALTASHTGQPNSAITIGANTGQENVFDKMQMGIWTYDSKTKIQNNVIQNIKSSIAPYGGVNAGIMLWGPFFGAGNGSYMEVGGSSTAYKNTFINNDNGICNNEESTLLTTYNTFSVQGTGIYVNTNNNGKTVNIRNNNFYQNNLGVKCYANTYVTTSIKDNNFDNTATAVGTYADNFAIHCTEAILATNPNAYPAFDIDNNKISGYYNGIYTSQTLLPVIYDNEIHMRQDNTTDHWQSGINAANTNSASINNNIVDMTSYNQWAYWQLGINLSTNQVPKVQCNSINNLNMAITASGSNITPANNGIIGNYMQNANFGIWLVNNGEIGNQAGNTGSNSSDNAWASSCNYYTYAQNSSNPNTDIFFTRSGGGYDLPNGKVGYDGSGSRMFGNNSSAASTGSCNANAATPSNTKLSGAASLAKLMQTAEVIAGDYNQVTNFSMAAASNLAATDDMNNNQVNRNAILRRQLLSNIMLQQIDVKDNKTLNTFMSNVVSENTGLLFAIDSLIHQAEKDSTKIAIAKQANAVITPNNKVEQGQQAFNDLYLTYLAQNKTATHTDVVALETLATQCPMFYGVSVYQARALLFNLTHQHYRSACENVTPNTSSKRLADQQTIVEKTDISVYPNPANTAVYVNANNYETLVLKLYDVMGHLVIDKVLASKEKIDIQNLSNGIYIYKLCHNEQELKVGKLIITH